MARKARAAVLYDGCYAHVFSRSIEKRRIFQDQRDFSFFKDLFVKAKGQSPFFVFHYCFMHTHFHLVVGIRSLEAFSRGMQWVKWQYTRAYNLKYKRWGPLWRERFKSVPQGVTVTYSPPIPLELPRAKSAGVLGGSLKRGDFSNGKIAKKEDYDAREEECCGFVGFFEFVGLAGFGGFVRFRPAGAGAGVYCD